MSTGIYRYDTGHYFSTAARVGSWLVSFFALLYLFSGVWVAALVVLLGPVQQFAKSFIEFDLQQQTYRQGIRLGGMAWGAKKPLPGFDFLFLKKNSYSRTMESRGSMSVSRTEKFDGYLKLSNGVKLHLLQLNGKEKAMQKLQQMAQDLHTELRDLTGMKYN